MTVDWPWGGELTFARTLPGVIAYEIVGDRRSEYTWDKLRLRPVIYDVRSVPFPLRPPVPDAVKSEYGTPETTEIQSPEVLKADAGTSENGSSESPESEPFEVSKPDANKNEGNKSEISKPDFTKLYPSSVPAPTEDGIREQLEYDVLLERRPERKARYDKIVALIADTLLSRADTVRINGADVPKARVAERFGALSFEHIEYVLDRMDESPTAIRSIRAWLLTALYNAPVTFDSYMNARVLRDMPWLAGA